MLHWVDEWDPAQNKILSSDETWKIKTTILIFILLLSRGRRTLISILRYRCRRSLGSICKIKQILFSMP